MIPKALQYDAVACIILQLLVVQNIKISWFEIDVLILLYSRTSMFVGLPIPISLTCGRIVVATLLHCGVGPSELCLHRCIA